MYPKKKKNTFYHFCFPREPDIYWWTFENIYGTQLAIMNWCLKQDLLPPMPMGGKQVMWMFEICQFEQYSSLIGKKHFYLFLKHVALWVKFYFSHLWNRLRVQAVVSFPINSMRSIKMEECAESPLPLDLCATMTTGSDGGCSEVGRIQKHNSFLSPGKCWPSYRARSLKRQENLGTCSFM